MQFVAGIKRRTEPLKQASWMIRQLTDCRVCGYHRKSAWIPLGYAIRLLNKKPGSRIRGKRQLKL